MQPHSSFICDVCKRPIANQAYYEHQGKRYHTDCYDKWIAPRCAYCGKILSKYVQDAWGTQFCPEHQTFPRCDFCGRYITPQEHETRPEKDFTRCSVCRATGVELLTKALPTFNLLFRWISQQGMTFDGAQVRLGLYTRDELGIFRSASEGADFLGTTRYSRYFQDSNLMRLDIEIALLRGMPATLFQGTAVHELTHAWLACHNVTTLDSLHEEGFCELLAFTFYQSIPSMESRYYADRIATSPDPVYGAGFRQVRAIAERSSLRKVIETLGTHARLF